MGLRAAKFMLIASLLVVAGLCVAENAAAGMYECPPGSGKYQGEPCPGGVQVKPGGNVISGGSSSKPSLDPLSQAYCHAVEPGTPESPTAVLSAAFGRDPELRGCVSSISLDALLREQVCEKHAASVLLLFRMAAARGWCR